MKEVCNVYLEKNLFDTVEAERKTLPRSVFLEKVIDENIDTVEPDADNIHCLVYINSGLYNKIIQKTQGKKVSTYLEKVIKMGVVGNGI